MTVSRRALLSAGGAVAVAPAMAAERTAPTSKTKRIFVLVHGGGHGGWCWKRVAEPLRAKGHMVYAPTMTGVCDRVHLLSPDVDLDMNITDIVNLLKWEDLTNIILVGHSYGGMVIPGVADRAIERIGHMVFLDAAHPKNGDPLWKDTGGAGGNLRRPSRIINGVEMTSIPDENLITRVLGVTKPEDVAWLMDKVTAQPLKTFTQPLRLQNEEAVHKLPTTDIWRKSILENQQESGREFTWAQRVWAIGSPSHDLMVTDPEQVTEMLLRVAAI